MNLPWAEIEQKRNDRLLQHSIYWDNSQVYQKFLIKIINIEGIMNKHYALLTASLSKFMNCDREQKIRKKSTLSNSCYEHQKACLLI
jgi:hypothetical protein